MVVKVSVIGNEHVVVNHLLHHRVAPVLDVNDAVLIYGGAAVIVPLCHKGKGGQDVCLCHGLGCLLDAQHFVCNLVPDVPEGFIFQGNQFILRPKDDILQFLKFCCNIAFCVSKGLLSGIVVRDKVLVGICDFQIIAEYLVVPDAQVFDSGLFPFLCFQLHQPCLPFRLGMAQLVNLLVVPFLYDAPVPDGNGRVFLDGCIHQLVNVFQDIKL